MRRILALSFVQRGLMLAVYVASTMILARLLTPEQVGIFSMTAAFVGIGAAIREFGMSEFLIQERKLNAAIIRSVYGVAIVTGCIVGCMVLLAAPILSAIYREPQVKEIGYVLSLNFFILPFATPAMALLVREMSLARAWGVQSAAIIVQYAASIWLAWKGFGPVSLAWGSVASSVCSVLLLYVLRPSELRMLPTLAGSRPAWVYGSKFAAASSLEVAAKNVHEFAIPSAFGFAALGLYSRAAGLFEQFNQNVTRAVSRVLLPVFAADARAGSFDLKRMYGVATANFTAIAWPFFAFVAVAAEELVLLLFGAQWKEAAPLLRLMCIAGIINSSHCFAGDVLAGRGDIGAKLRIVSIATPVWVVLCLAGSLISVQAIALLSAGPSIASLLLYTRRLNQLIGFSALNLVRECRKSAALAALVTTACIALKLSFPNAPVAISVAGSVVIASLTWAATLYLLRHPLLDELAPILKRLRTVVRV